MRQLQRYAGASSRVNTDLRVLRDDLLSGGSEADAVAYAAFASVRR